MYLSTILYLHIAENKKTNFFCWAPRTQAHSIGANVVATPIYRSRLKGQDWEAQKSKFANKYYITLSYGDQSIDKSLLRFPEKFPDEERMLLFLNNST